MAFHFSVDWRCNVFALALLEMEYERYLPQSWIGLRGFWHLIGIEALVRCCFG